MILIQMFVQKYKKKLLLPVIVIGIMLFISIQSFIKSATPKVDSIQTIPLKENFTEETIEYVENPVVFVEVKGAVTKPGVYELSDGDRVLNAIEMAGGYLMSSNSKHINHAERVKDEMVIYIPEDGEEEEETEFSTTSSQSSLVNINNADATVLSTLPGIGAAKAEAIIAHRDQIGAFKDNQDLMKVTGIGQKTYEKLEPLITIK